RVPRRTSFAGHADRRAYPAHRRRLYGESSHRDRSRVPDRAVDVDMDVSPLARLQDPGVRLRGQPLLSRSRARLSAAAHRLGTFAAPAPRAPWRPGPWEPPRYVDSRMGRSAAAP